jgi:hypothetical protein
MELKALRRHLHGQILNEIQAYWRDFRSVERAMAEREQKLAERRSMIESRLAAQLLKKRQELPNIDWSNPPDFEGEAARKVHQQNLAELDQRFSAEAFLDRLVPHICTFASNVAIFERTVIPILGSSQRPAHCKRVVNAIVRLILPPTPVQDPLPEGIKSARLSEEKVWGGTVISGPFEILQDEHGRTIEYRRALHAECRGEFEHLPLGNVWGLLRALKKPRRLLRQTITARVRSDLVQMAADRRSRKQMVEDCLERHAGYGAQGITHKNITEAARVSLNDFYQWRANNPRIGPQKHRRILFVVCCPLWPPPRI